MNGYYIQKYLQSNQRSSTIQMQKRLTAEFGDMQCNVMPTSFSFIPPILMYITLG